MSTSGNYYLEQLEKQNEEIYTLASKYRHKELDTDDILVRYELMELLQSRATIEKLAFAELYEKINKLENPSKKKFRFWK